jgi:peptidoglycan hydrolase CwlO-like protein
LELDDSSDDSPGECLDVDELTVELQHHKRQLEQQSLWRSSQVAASSDPQQSTAQAEKAAKKARKAERARIRAARTARRASSIAAAATATAVMAADDEATRMTVSADDEVRTASLYRVEAPPTRLLVNALRETEIEFSFARPIF